MKHTAPIRLTAAELKALQEFYADWRKTETPLSGKGNYLIDHLACRGLLTRTDSIREGVRVDGKIVRRKTQYEECLRIDLAIEAGAYQHGAALAYNRDLKARRAAEHTYSMTEKGKFALYYHRLVGR